VDSPHEGDAVDLRRVAPVGARRDRVLVLSRQVGKVRVAVEEPSGALDDTRGVEELAGIEPLHGAAGDVADGIATTARSRDAGGVEMREDVGKRRELEPVELDVLTRRELAVAASEPVRDLPDRTQLRGGEVPARKLHAQHERPDLRLVVVEPPPLEADDVLLGDALVARGDERGQLVANPERCLLPLQALDRVALEHQLPVRLRFRGRRPRGVRCHGWSFRWERRASRWRAPCSAPHRPTGTGLRTRRVSGARG